MHCPGDNSSSLEKLFNDLNAQTCSYNSVRFLSFRIALKVRALVTKFKLTYVDYKVALFQLNQEGIAFGRQFTLSVERARHIIQSIYHSLAPVHFADISVRDLTEGLVAVFARILYPDEGHLSREPEFDSNEFKLLFFSLLNLNLSMKYMYLYQMMCFPNATISLEQVRSIFRVLSKIAICLDNAGADLHAHIDSLTNGIMDKTENNEIDKSAFLEFLNTRPLELDWVHSFHVLLSSANMRHEAQCDVCGTYPIIGLRFRCLCCFDYDLCTTCHLLGSFSKDHLPSHDTQQLSRQLTPLEDVKTLFEILCRKIFRSRIFTPKYRALTYKPSSCENSCEDIRRCSSISQLIGFGRRREDSLPADILSTATFRPLSSRCCDSQSNSCFDSAVPKATSSIVGLTQRDNIPSRSVASPPTRSNFFVPVAAQPQERRGYDNVPTLQEVVRSVEMTNIYDRYVNISSSTIISTTRRREVLAPIADRSAINRDLVCEQNNSLVNRSPRSAWRLFSRRPVLAKHTFARSVAHPEPPQSALVLYQNVRHIENDLLNFHDRRPHNESWPQVRTYSDDYGFLPESHSTLTSIAAINRPWRDGRGLSAAQSHI